MGMFSATVNSRRGLRLTGSQPHARSALMVIATRRCPGPSIARVLGGGACSAMTRLGRPAVPLGAWRPVRVRLVGARLGGRAPGSALRMSFHSSRTATTDAISEAVRDARVEAAVALIAFALLVVNGLVSRSQGWRFRGAVVDLDRARRPGSVFLILLVVSALGDVRPGRRRDIIIVLLGVLALASLTPPGSSSGARDGRPHRGPAPAERAGRLVHQPDRLRPAVLGARRGWAAAAPRAGERGRRLPVPAGREPGPRRDPWRPRLLDYVYLSLTNSLAFSPTDAMPLSRRAKSLMGLESLISTVVVLFVIARAVNVLGS